MRAKTVPVKAYIFDFDETLVKTDAKVHVYNGDKKVRSLTPEEFNTYKKKLGERYDMSDFTDPRIIDKARKFKMWPALENISNAVKMGRSTSDIYILTARSPKAQLPIHNYLTRQGINIPIENVICIGLDEEGEQDIAGYKEKVLKDLKKKYAEITFFDDSEENVELASKVGGIRTRLVDWNK
jgi:phosphoglycolate phosphatase-like HAD superfamily hydrolase